MANNINGDIKNLDLGPGMFNFFFFFVLFIRNGVR